VIYLRNATRRHRVDERRIVRTARALLAALGEANSSVAVSLVGDRGIRSLNRRHRGKDRATDVLSFPLAGPSRGRAAVNGAAPERLLGDLVISLDAAQRQAGEYAVPLVREVERLMIHGLLHLLGHDHETAPERARMVRAERRLAKAIGMPWPEGYRSGLS
jgi:probable rRNA maturation factor